MTRLRRTRTWSSRIAAAVLYVTLAGPPLLFGSRDATTIALWCALLGGGLLFASPKRLQRAHLWLLAGIAFLILCFGFVLHEQLSEHPWIASFNPIWAAASDALGRELVPSVSVMRDQPFFALGLPLANVLALTLGLIVGSDSERARLGVHVMAWAGLAYAAYGILAFIVTPNMILWREKSYYLGNLTGTFINRNTAAAYFGSCAAVWLVLFMGATRRNLPPGRLEWKRVPEHLVQKTRSDVLVRFVMMFFCLSAMFMTSSRGGSLISLAVMMLAFMIFFLRDMPRGIGFLIAIAACIVTGLVLLQLLGGNIENRITAQGLSDEGRLSVYRSMLKMISDNPWFGSGLGTFASAFPAYRSGDISMEGLWDKGHNTHLEFATEMGLPLTGVVALAWIIALVVLASSFRKRRRDMIAPLAAFAMSLIALLHSSIDFTLQVAGYSIVLFALLGVGLAQAVRRNDPSLRDDDPALPTSRSQRRAPVPNGSRRRAR